MTEQELVAYTKKHIVEGLQIASKNACEANSLADLKKIRQRLRATTKDLKTSINMMEHYLSVNETIMRIANKE